VCVDKNSKSTLVWSACRFGALKTVIVSQCRERAIWMYAAAIF
jgi:hypothetical protein